MNKQRALAIAAAVTAVTTLALWHTQSGRDERTDDVLVLYGNIDVREANLGFNNLERIDAILVAEGERVIAGQLLATVEKRRFAAELGAAKSRHAARAANLARLESGSRPEEVRQARATVAAAEARLTDAQLTATRLERLRDERAASQQTVDDARSRLATTRADLKVARESLALALAGPRREEIEQAAAELEAAAAEVTLRQEILADTELRAPKKGVIRNRILEPGDMATPQSPVFTLAFDDPVWVRAYVPETQLGRIRPGMQASIESDSFPGKRYPGWVGYLSPTAEFTPKNVETPELRTRLVYQARIYACNPEGELRLGMPVTVQIELRQAAPTDTVPNDAVPDCATASK